MRWPNRKSGGRYRLKDVHIADLDAYVPMQLVRDCFVAQRADLVTAFAGWLLPLASPVRRQLRNPFTDEPMFRANGEPWIVETRAPDGPWPDDVRCPNLTAFCRRDIWPIRSSELVALAGCLPSPVSEELREALFAPPSYGWALWAIPHSATHQLAPVTAIESVAARWVDALKAEPNWDELEDVDWSATISYLVELARRAVNDHAELFLYEGPRAHR